MKLFEYIKNEIFVPRLSKTGVLVIYDHNKRYKDICADMGSKKIKVVDASESSILGRETALKILNDFGYSRAKIEGVVIYVPAKLPITDEDKQRDPFSIYTVCGTYFPDGDGDEYMSICLKFKPDHSAEVRKIFGENNNPPFEVIDAIGGGAGWPILHALLKSSSAVEIILSLLAPSEDQLGALKSQDGWVTELKELLQSCLGMKLVTKGKTWQTIAEELWRFILFSEFCLDLPEPLPESLATVPRSDTNARSIIEDICDKLRYNDKTKPTYIERAEIVEKELELSKRCKSISDFGLRDTFAFEERSFLLKAIDGYKKNNLDQLRKILERHSKSIWTADAEIQAQWEIIVSALNLFKTCEDNERQLSQHSKSLESLIEFYVGSLREVDRMQREFEQSVSDMHEFDAMTPVIEIARKSYMNLAAKAQNIFIKHIEENGWPPVGRLSNSNVFDTFIAPKLQEKGNKVAYILVDSLRYELGVVLEKQLTELGATQINASSAKLPTVTSVGMASLLPGADQSFSLEFQDETLIPNIGGGELKNVTKRMDFIRQRYGQRFHEMPLQEFLVHKKNIPSTVELLVLRSAEIDSSLETNPELTLKTIQDAIKRIRIAVSKLQKQDFKEIVIATDHGFFLNYSPEAGDVCPKPPGNWHNVHDRILVGDGSGDNSNYSLPAETLGVKGNFAKISGPRALVPYCCGKIYFHGGLSLQESILPVITLKTREAQTEKISFYVLISYKNNASRITTRLPVLDLQLYAEEFFALDHTVEILLEAVDKNNKIVGSSKIGGRVDPSTGTIHIKAGERIQITMKMDEEFEGKFTVRALNPSTMAEYCKLELETNYVG